MASSFDKQLEKILKGDVDALVDKLPNEDETEAEQIPDEMAPVLYDEKESNSSISDKDLQSDYNAARSNLYGLMGKSNAALELTLRIAMMSEHPRALEVAANLIKTSSDISKELVALHKAIEEKSKNGSDMPGGKYTQNNYYINDKKNAETIIDDLPDDEDGSNDESDFINK